MKKIYHLGTCDTCKRIIKELDPEKNKFEYQDIKTDKITEDQLEQMRSMTDSYESLFSKRARKYKELNLKEKNLTEDDIKSLILEEYTFLKRPVIILQDKIFIGNSPKTIQAVKAGL